MTVDAKEARRKYYREWRQKNREKCNQYQKTYWERKAEKINQERGAAIENC